MRFCGNVIVEPRELITIVKVKNMSIKRPSNIIDFNASLKMIKELLDLIGYGLTIYTLFRFVKKHRVDIVMAFMVITYPILLVYYLFKLLLLLVELFFPFPKSVEK